MTFDISELMLDLRRLNYPDLKAKYFKCIPKDYTLLKAVSDLKSTTEGLSIAIDQGFDVKLFPALEGIYLFSCSGGFEVFALERGGKGIPFQFRDLESAVKCKIDWVFNNNFGVRLPDSVLFNVDGL